MRERSCFDILSVPRDATLKDAKQAYKHLVKRWHPDQYGNDPEKQRVAQEKLKEINVAYRELIGVLKNTAGAAAPSQKPKTGKRRTPAGSPGHFKNTTFFQRITSFFKTHIGDKGKRDDSVAEGHSTSSFGPRRGAEGVRRMGKPTPDFSQVLNRTLRGQGRGSGGRRSASAGINKPGRRRVRKVQRRDAVYRTYTVPRRNSGDRVEKIKPIRPVGKIGE